MRKNGAKTLCWLVREPIVWRNITKLDKNVNEILIASSSRLVLCSTKNVTVQLRTKCASICYSTNIMSLEFNKINKIKYDKMCCYNNDSPVIFSSNYVFISLILYSTAASMRNIRINAMNIWINLTHILTVIIQLSTKMTFTISIDFSWEPPMKIILVVSVVKLFTHIYGETWQIRGKCDWYY